MRRRSLVALGAVVAISATLSGCGSGDDRSAAPPVSGDDFTAGTIVASASATGHPPSSFGFGGGQGTPPGPEPEGEVEDAIGRGFGPRAPQAAPQEDPVVDPGPGDGATGPVVSFPGSSTEISPPDAVGAIGRTHYVEVTNGGYAIYTREGSLQRSGSLGELWQGLEPCTSNPQGDPTIVYDGARTLGHQHVRLQRGRGQDEHDDAVRRDERRRGSASPLVVAVMEVRLGRGFL